MTVSDPMGLALWSDPISMPGGMDMAVSSLLVLAEAWQSECAWCEEQDTSQAQAETGAETRRHDSSAANEVVMLRTNLLYSSP